MGIEIVNKVKTKDIEDAESLKDKREEKLKGIRIQVQEIRVKILRNSSKHHQVDKINQIFKVSKKIKFL